MTDFFKRDDGFRLWRLTIWKLVNGCFKGFLGAWLAATASVDWSNLSASERSTILIGCWLVVSGILDAFFDQTISQIKQRSEPYKT